jgi:hypothetical protein
MSRNSIRFGNTRALTRGSTVAAALAVLLLGATPFARAQSSAPSFADTFADMQSLSSDSIQYQREKPVFSNAPAERVARFSLRDMQALSSDSPVWQVDADKPALDRGPTFAKTHPHGLSFAEYQALASNAPEVASTSNAGLSTMTAKAPTSVFGRAATTLR